ncbi:hypothetical protein BC828DRAFT_406563 [Blastocladiella britannica]|nr:hypothetical protein BC828DRAFT_406563 [Blastocladiella britannica]
MENNTPRLFVPGLLPAPLIPPSRRPAPLPTIAVVPPTPPLLTHTLAPDVPAPAEDNRNDDPIIGDTSSVAATSFYSAHQDPPSPSSSGGTNNNQPPPPWHWALFQACFGSSRRNHGSDGRPRLEPIMSGHVLIRALAAPGTAASKDQRRQQRQQQNGADVDGWWRAYSVFLVRDLVSTCVRDTGWALWLCAAKVTTIPTKPDCRLPLYTVLALSVYAPTDGTLALTLARPRDASNAAAASTVGTENGDGPDDTPTQRPRAACVWLLHPPSVPDAVAWFRALTVAIPSVARPPVPTHLRVAFPDVAPASELAVDVPVTWGSTVAQVRRTAMAALANSGGEREGDSSATAVSLPIAREDETWTCCWRRGDRILWIDDVIEVDDAHQENHTGLQMAIGPLTRTHALELRRRTRRVPVLSTATSTNTADPVCEGYLECHRRVMGSARAWDTQFVQQLGVCGRFLCVSQYSVPHTPLQLRRPVRAGRPSLPATPTSAASAAMAPAAGPAGEYIIQSPAPKESATTTATRVIDMLDITTIIVHAGCADCVRFLAPFATGPSAPVHVCTSARYPDPTAPAVPPRIAARFSLVVTRSGNVGSGHGDRLVVARFAAPSHAAMHVWVRSLAAAATHAKMAEKAWEAVYASVLKQNAALYRTERPPNEIAAMLVARAEMWADELTLAAGAIKACFYFFVAHRASVKHKYRGTYRPCLVMVTETALLLCRRVRPLSVLATASDEPSTSCLPTDPRKSLRHAPGGMYSVWWRIPITAHMHALVGYVNPTTGVAARDEQSFTVAPKAWGVADPCDGAGDGDSDDDETAMGSDGHHHHHPVGPDGTRGNDGDGAGWARTRGMTWASSLSRPVEPATSRHDAMTTPVADHDFDWPRLSGPLPFGRCAPEQRHTPSPPSSATAVERTVSSHRFLSGNRHSPQVEQQPPLPPLPPSPPSSGAASSAAATSDAATAPVSASTPLLQLQPESQSATGALPPGHMYGSIDPTPDHAASAVAVAEVEGQSEIQETSVGVPVVTQHEGPHQTALTIWIPPGVGDVVKRVRARGKAIIIDCRRKAERDEVLMAVQAVIARRVAESLPRAR